MRSEINSLAVEVLNKAFADPTTFSSLLLEKLLNYAVYTSWG